MLGPIPRLIHECVVNVSEGRDVDVLDALSHAAGPLLLDRHADPHHHRSVFTLAGPAERLTDAVRALAAEIVARVDVRTHQGAHPRIGALDVVPWVALTGWPLEPARLELAIDRRDDFATWAGAALKLPCFVYGPERSLPDVRRAVWTSLRPDFGPAAPHPTAGAAAVGARPPLVAYNLWLEQADLDAARAIAAGLRGPALRALGLQVGDAVQVSCNLIDPYRLGPEAVFDAVASRTGIARAELVGLVPATVLDAIPAHRRTELGMAPSSTIEARLEQAGLDGGKWETG